MAGAAHNRGNSRQDYETPLSLIRAVESRFGSLSVDLAARPDNAKAPQFITPEQDSLKTEWPTDRLCWLNPPFSNIAPWAKKCRETADKGGRIAFLVPASVGANWYRDFIHKKDLILFLNGRVDFIAGEGYPKDCLIAMFGYPQDFDVWTWKTAVTERE
jgi:phage N-6-adenine-methyltransferase